MTLASAVNRVSYLGASSTHVFSYTFRVFDEDHLLVTVKDTSDVETTLTITTDYTVSGVGDSGGGSVTLVNSSQAWLTAGELTTGYTIVIRRVLPITQETDIRNQGDFFPESHEDEFDKLTMVDQQQQDAISRSLTLPETLSSSDVDTTLPIPSAGLALGWNATEDGLENIANAGDLSVSAFIETLLDDTTAGAARTTLGFSTFIQTVTDDTTALAARATLGIPTAPELSSSSLIQNLTLTGIVATNALTIAVKTSAGTDATATDPATVPFRSATSATGTYAQRVISAALSMSIPSATTIGTLSGIAHILYVYLIDNAGTLELAVSLALFDEGTVQSSTAVSGGTAAGTLYSTAARTSKAIRLIGRIAVTEATAGTWATAPSEISLVPFINFFNTQVIGDSGNGHGAVNTKIRRWTNTTTVGADITYADSSNNGMSLTVNNAGIYSLSYTDSRGAAAAFFGWSINSAQLTTAITSITEANKIISTQGHTNVYANCSAVVRCNVGDVVRTHTDGTVDDSGGTSQFRMVRIA